MIQTTNAVTNPHTVVVELVHAPVVHSLHSTNSGIAVNETHLTDTEMIDFSKTHAETNTEKIFNTVTIQI